MNVLQAKLRAQPFFYGWVVMILAALAQICTLPGQTLGVSLFNPFFKSALELTDTQLSSAYMLGTLLAAVPQTLIGAWMDRFGIRAVLLATALLLGLACLAVHQVTGLTSLFLCFFLLRLLGQGALSLTAMNTLAMWFRQRLGRASALMSLSTGLAYSVLPGLIFVLIQWVGWRRAYPLLGLAVWVLLLPPVLLLYRNRPEDIGEVPDGLAFGATSKGQERAISSPLSEEIHWTLPQALRTRAYWIVAMATGAWAMVGTGVMFHIVGLCQEQGLTAEDAPKVLSGFWTCFAGMQFLGGFLADALPARFLLSIAMLLLSCGLGMALSADTLQQALAYGALLGLGQGLSAVVNATLWVRYYGRLHLGKIRGSLGTALVACTSLGPFLMGWSRDVWGSFGASLTVFLGLFLCLIPLVLLATPPSSASWRPRAHRDSRTPGAL